MIVTELLNDIDGVVTRLGINPKFKENPAYKTVLAHLYTLIDQMGITNNDSELVSENKNFINLNWIYKAAGDYYDFKIVVPSNNEIICERTNEEFTKDKDGKSVIRKKVVNISATLDDIGGIKILSKYGEANDYECGNNDCNVYYGVEEKNYNLYGVMERREYRSFPKTKMRFNVRNITSEQMFINTSGAFSAINYRKKEVYERCKLDVANVLIVDRVTGEYYSGKELIDSTYGLADLSINGRVRNNLNRHVVINPLMDSEIEEILEKEDPRVAEGLRIYTKDRENFEYDSEKDKSYVYRASK